MRYFDQDFRVNYRSLHQLNCMLLHAYYQDDGEATIRANFPTMIQATDTVVELPATAFATKTLVIYDSVECLIICQGIEDLTQKNNMTAGWTMAAFGHTPLSLGACLWTEMAARSIIARFPVSLTGKNVAIIGHSYGGATAQVLTVYLKEVFPTVRPKTISYGSPRPGNSTFATYAVNHDITRINTTGDPVPKIPPHSDEFPAIHLMLLTAMSRGMNSQVQPPRGFRLTDNYSLIPEEESTASFTEFVLRLSDFISGGDGFGANLHSIGYYVRQFSNAPIDRSLQLTVQSHRLPPERAYARSRLTPADHRLASAQLHAIASRPPSEQTSVFPPFIPDPSDPPYRAHKQSGVWGVYIGGKVVELSKGKRRAKVRARALNKQRRTSMV